MRKFVLMAIASFLSCGSFAQAFWPEATDSSLKIGVGYRQDHFKWETDASTEASGSGYSYDRASDHGLPVSWISKNKWKNINIWQIELSGQYVTCDNVYLRASGDYGWITSGKVTDDDYIVFGNYSGSAASGSGRTPYSSSSSKAKGNVYDVKLAVGYQFQLCDDTLSIAPLVGYSWHGQRFRDSHLKHCVYSQSAEAPPLEARSRSSYGYSYYSSNSGYSYSDYYSGDHSSYHTRWNGPFIGFDFDYSLCCEWNLFGGYEFHFAEFHAKAKWNRRFDAYGGNFNFNQRSKNAYGNYIDIGVQWAMCDCWTLDLKGEFQFWRAHHGRDRLKTCQSDFGDVKKKCYLEIPTRNTEWCSAGVTLSAGMTF